MELEDNTELIDDGSTAAAEKPVDKPADKAGDKPGDETAAQLRELRETQKVDRARLNELEQSNRYWHEQATRGGKADKPAEKEEELTLSDDPVEALSSNDPKRIKGFLKGLGLVDKADLQGSISRASERMSEEQQLLQNYPEITDQSSEFFKTASRHYNDLIRENPKLKNDYTTTIKIAARMAKAELGTSQRDESEEDRVKRVNSQGGPRTRPASRGGADEESKNLSPAQKRIVAAFQSAGAEIDEDKYRKRAADGVRMGGRGR